MVAGQGLEPWTPGYEPSRSMARPVHPHDGVLQNMHGLTMHSGGGGTRTRIPLPNAVGALPIEHRSQDFQHTVDQPSRPRVLVIRSPERPVDHVPRPCPYSVLDTAPKKENLSLAPGRKPLVRKIRRSM